HLEGERRLGGERAGVEVERGAGRETRQGRTPSCRRDERTAASRIGVECPGDGQSASRGGHGEEGGDPCLTRTSRERHQAGGRRRQAGWGEERWGRCRVERR